MATKRKKISKSPNTTSKKQKQIGYIIDVDPLQILNIIDSNSNSKKEIALTKIFDDFKKYIKGSKFTKRFENFEDLNKKINSGDCIKDGTSVADLQQFDLFDTLFDTFSLAELKDLAHYVIDKAEKDGYAVRQEFTREKKGDDTIKERYKGYDFDIGYDAGLGPENFLTLINPKQFEIFTNFGKHIDPFIITQTRVFPPQGKNIEITENTFKQIGYDNCYVNATARSLDNFEYTIRLSGVPLEQTTGTAKDKDKNIKDFFIGNTQKNAFIKSASKDQETKKAMIVGKSWGDKLQTFIMWIKHLTDISNRITVMSTCDEIVMLFSIILGLPCFYTDIGLNKDKQKINRVLYFNTYQMDPANAKSRFDTEKRIILDGYTNFIKLVKECDEKTDIFIKEIDDTPLHFKKSFYDAIIADLTAIKTKIIDNIRVTTSDSVQDINDNIYNLKKTKINDFLKKGSNGLIYMIRSKAKYNENINNNSKEKLALATNRVPETKIRSATFHFIATTYFNVNMKGVNMRDVNMEDVNMEGVNMEGGGGSSAKIQKNMDLIFDMDPKYVYLEDNSKFDANLSLFKELYKLYDDHMHHTDFHFISLYSECLYRLSIEPDYTSENLSTLVNNIFKDFNEFKEANAELEPYVAKKDKTPDVIPTGVAAVDKHISPKDKNDNVITVFQIPIRYKKTTGRRSRSRDKKTRGRRSRSNSTKRSRSKDRKHMVISRSKSRSRSRSRSRDRISQ